MSELPPEEGEDDGSSVDARGGQGMLFGSYNRQTNYFFSPPVSAGAAARPPLVTFSGAVDSPYRGLDAFGEDDAAFFFGRDQAVDEVMERLAARLSVPGLLIVSGASGAGKSSLLRAGVIPRLVAAGLGPHRVITPGKAPLSELAVAVAAVAGTDAAATYRSLREDPPGFALTARQAAASGVNADGGSAAAVRAGKQGHPLLPGGQGSLLLVIDQFEQVFTQCAGDAERRAFIAALHAAATVRQGPEQVPAAGVILVVRADFEARCAEHEEIADAVQERYLVRPMTETQLRLAITGPAERLGGSVSAALVEELLRAVRTPASSAGPAGSRPGLAGAALPHLSHALDQAWRGRAADVLGLADYERTGGIEGSIAASADRAYRSLPIAVQPAVMPVFMRLVSVSSDLMVTAGRARRAELVAGTAATDTTTVLEAFAAERLLTLTEDEVEISHEVLLSAWDRLAGWLDGDRADLARYSRLAADARDWDDAGRPASYLYGAGRLAEIDAAAARWAAVPGRDPVPGPAAGAFLGAARRATRRALLIRRGIAAVLFALALAAAAAAGTASYYAANAGHQQSVALSRQLAAQALTIQDTDPVIARQLALAAWSTFPTQQAASLILSLLTEQQQDGILPADTSDVYGGDVAGVAFSPDGRELASVGGDGAIRFWNLATGQATGPAIQGGNGADDAVSLIGFSPNGKLLASADHRYIHLWNPLTGKPVGRPMGADTSGLVSGGVFSSDGRRLYSVDSYGVLTTWDLLSGQLISSVPPPAGIFTHPVVPDKLAAEALSASGLYARCLIDGVVTLINPVTGQQVGSPFRVGSDQSVSGLAFSPDGRQLAVAAGGSVRVWDTDTRRPAGPAIRAGAQDGESTPVFGPGGRWLAVAAGDTVSLWNPVTGRPVRQPVHAGTGTSGVSSIAFSSDGELMASGDGDGTVRLWDTATGQPHGTVIRNPDPQGGILGFTFNPAGELLASGDGNGIVKVWDLATGKLAGPVIAASTGANAYVGGVAFSPDGRLLASNDGGGTVKLWDVATGKLAGPVIAASANGVAFSPDGRLLAGAGGDGTVRLWDLATGKPVGPPMLAGHLSVISVAFSPDGRLLASDDGTIRFWDPATGQPVGSDIPGVSDDPLAFTSDGKWLATVDGNDNIYLWQMALFSNPYTALCADVGALTSQAWAVYAPGIPQPKSCT